MKSQWYDGFRKNRNSYYGGDTMLTLLLPILAVVVIGIVVVLFVGTSGIVIFLIFGDVIIGCFLVYKIIKAIIKK